VTFLIGVLVGGLVIGALGRLLVPGPNPIGLWRTVLCGIGGSFVGWLLGRYLFHFGFVTLALEVLVAAAFVSLVTRRQRGHAARRT
jgi:uncharacterized membrane protein YeaQ/YmgE (transglycosylase-associated protein family)